GGAGGDVGHRARRQPGHQRPPGVPRPRGPSRRDRGCAMTTLRNLVGIPVARVALTILGLVVLLAVLGGHLAPYDPLRQFPDVLAGPGGRHLLGTDYVGRDVLS